MYGVNFILEAPQTIPEVRVQSPCRKPSSKDDVGILGSEEVDTINYVQEYDDDVFAVELLKGEHGLGLGLIDGLVC